MINLFVTDLDGTLIDSKKNIPQKNINSIKRLKQRDVKIAICTGRTLLEVEYIPQFKDISNYVDYIIYENGASCIDNKTKQIIFKQELKYDDIKKIYEQLSDFEMMFEIYTDGKPHCDETMFELKRYKEFITPDFYPLVEDTRIKVDNIIDFVKDKSIQMILISFLEHEISVKAYDKIKNIDNYITFAGIKGLEIHDNSVDKGKGIQSLANLLNIPKSKILSIGDSYNDLPMRDAVGTLVAMQNSTSKLKEIADHITLSNDDSGVSHVIEKMLL